MNGDRVAPSITVLGDVVIAPAEAFLKLLQSPRWIGALLVLLAAIVLGGLIQAPINHHENAVSTQQYYAQHPSAAVSEQNAAVAAAEHPPLVNDILNDLIYFIIVSIGLCIEAGVTAALVAIAGGNPRFWPIFAAIVNIGVWVVGLYYVILSCLMRFAFSNQHDGNALDTVFPSLLMVFSGTHSSFARGVLASCNPFTLGALWLHAQALMVVCQLKVRPAYVTATLLLVLEILASGVVVALFG